MLSSEKILVGKVVATQGLRGEVRVQTYSAQPTDFKSFRVISDKFESDAFHFVRVLKPNVIIAKIDGVDDRNAAEILRGTNLFVLRSELPELNQGEYYQSDLIGFDVVRDNEKIAKVAGFQNFGAKDIIELDNGDMVSFFGADVNFETKTITVK